MNSFRLIRMRISAANSLRALSAALLLSAGVSGCGGGSLVENSSPDSGELTAQRTLSPYRDPWDLARPRLWDIDDQPFDEFIQNGGFSYAGRSVTLFYDSAPQTPYFQGRIVARGLKPNFAYQLKLAGKPERGPRGWGEFGDDLSNRRIGEAGRWWDESAQGFQTNFDDAHFRRYYLEAPGNGSAVHSIYGYLLMGIFVTDASGNADLVFDGSRSYHVIWQDKQNSKNSDVVAGIYSVRSNSAQYGYGREIAPKNVRLWYEYENGRPNPVRLPAGEYNCRILITEESFHAGFDGANSGGGFYQTVLATEDFDGADQPDTNLSNDVRFTIR